METTRRASLRAIQHEAVHDYRSCWTVNFERLLWHPDSDDPEEGSYGLVHYLQTSDTTLMPQYIVKAAYELLLAAKDAFDGYTDVEEDSSPLDTAFVDACKSVEDSFTLKAAWLFAKRLCRLKLADTSLLLLGLYNSALKKHDPHMSRRLTQAHMVAYLLTETLQRLRTPLHFCKEASLDITEGPPDMSPVPRLDIETPFDFYASTSKLPAHARRQLCATPPSALLNLGGENTRFFVAVPFTRLPWMPFSDSDDCEYKAVSLLKSLDGPGTIPKIIFEWVVSTLEWNTTWELMPPECVRQRVPPPRVTAAAINAYIAQGQSASSPTPCDAIIGVDEQLSQDTELEMDPTSPASKSIAVYSGTRRGGRGTKNGLGVHITMLLGVGHVDDQPSHVNVESTTIASKPPSMSTVVTRRGTRSANVAAYNLGNAADAPIQCNPTNFDAQASHVHVEWTPTVSTTRSMTTGTPRRRQRNASGEISIGAAPAATIIMNDGSNSGRGRGRGRGRGSIRSASVSKTLRAQAGGGDGVLNATHPQGNPCVDGAALLRMNKDLDVEPSSTDLAGSITEDGGGRGRGRAKGRGRGRGKGRGRGRGRDRGRGSDRSASVSKTLRAQADGGDGVLNVTHPQGNPCVDGAALLRMNKDLDVEPSSTDLAGSITEDGGGRGRSRVKGRGRGGGSDRSASVSRTLHAGGGEVARNSTASAPNVMDNGGRRGRGKGKDAGSGRGRGRGSATGVRAGKGTRGDVSSTLPVMELGSSHRGKGRGRGRGRGRVVTSGKSAMCGVGDVANVKEHLPCASDEQVPRSASAATPSRVNVRKRVVSSSAERLDEVNPLTQSESLVTCASLGVASGRKRSRGGADRLADAVIKRWRKE